MLPTPRVFAVLAITAAAACWLQAQTQNPSTDAASKYPVPTVTLSFGKLEPTPLGKKGWVMIGRSTCAPDGTLFAEMIATPLATPPQLGWALNSLTGGTDVVRYAASSAPGYKNISDPTLFFASDNAVVTLVGAERLSGSVADSMAGNKRAARNEVTLALVYDRKGTLQRTVPIPPKIDPLSIGMYGSGDLLVIAKDASTNRLRLLVLDHDGAVKNELSLFDYDYDAHRKAEKKQPLAKFIDAAQLIQIVPHGDDLLLVPRLTQATVIEVNEQGIVRATDIDLPHGYLLRALFPGDGPYWTASTYDHVKIVTGKESTYAPGADLSKNPTPVKVSTETSPVFEHGPLFQFNSFDGSLVRRINAPAKMHANIICAHDGTFTAVTKNRKTGHLELQTGTVPQ